MGGHPIAAACAILQAAPDSAAGSLHLWLLVGGSASTLITLVLSSALYRAFCRWGSFGLETGSFVIALTGPVGLFVAFWGAMEIVDGVGRAPSGPPADTSAFLLLLAATVGVGAILLGAVVLRRTSPPPLKHRGPAYVDPLAPERELFGGCLLFAVAADLVTAVLAVLGLAGVIHLTVVKTVAWAYLGLGLGVLAGGVLVAIVWVVAGILDA